MGRLTATTGTVMLLQP